MDIYLKSTNIYLKSMNKVYSKKKITLLTDQRDFSIGTMKLSACIIDAIIKYTRTRYITNLIYINSIMLDIISNTL